MPGLLSNRKPYPHHIIVNGLPLMLKANEQTGQLFEKKAVTGDSVTPTVFDYGSYDPFVEKPYVFGRLVGGMGEALQRSATALRYKRTKNADFSIGGMGRLGPYFADGGNLNLSVPQDATFFLATPQAGRSWWTFAGRYALYQSGGVTSWVLSKDFGAIQQAKQAALYAPIGGTDAQIYVTTANGQLWQYDGINTWTQMVLPVGMNARWVERNGNELWIGSSLNVIRKTTGDPGTGAGAWGGPIYVGDSSSPLTGLKSLASQLFVGKTDGVYSVNTDGSINELFPEFRGSVQSTNFSALGVWNGRLWFRFQDAFYYLTGGAVASLFPVGPERLLEQFGIRGVPVAFVGDRNWFGYLALYDSVSATSYLLKYGTWLPTDGSNTAVPGYQFSEVWNGSIKEWAGKQVTSMGIQVAPNPYLWVGFADGSLEYTLLPAFSPDPARDSNCVFTTEESYVDWPDHHAMAQADAKHFRTFVGEGPKLDATNYVSIGYRTDPNAAFTDLPDTLTATGKRVSTPAAGVSGVTLQVREYLHGTRTSTPEVEAVTILEQVRPAMIREFSATAKAARNLARRDGMVDRRTGEQIRDALMAVVDGSKAPGNGPVTVTFPDETNQAIDVIDYQALQVPDQYGLAWDIALRMVGFVTNTIFGTWDRMAAGYTWDDAAKYSWDSALTL